MTRPSEERLKELRDYAESCYEGLEHFAEIDALRFELEDGKNWLKAFAQENKELHEENEKQKGYLETERLDFARLLKQEGSKVDALREENAKLRERNEKLREAFKELLLNFNAYNIPVYVEHRLEEDDEASGGKNGNEPGT